MPSRSRATRPTSRLPATQPAMFAAWSKPTFRPLVRRSSWTARCRVGKTEPHEHGRQAEDRQGQVDVQVPELLGLPGAAEAEPALAPVAARTTRSRAWSGGSRTSSEMAIPAYSEEHALQEEERLQRVAQPGDEWRADQAADRGAEQVQREHGPEGERGGLHRHLEHAEPQDLEGERAEAAERVEGEPQAEAVADGRVLVDRPPRARPRPRAGRAGGAGRRRGRARPPPRCRRRRRRRRPGCRRRG